MWMCLSVYIHSWIYKDGMEETKAEHLITIRGSELFTRTGRQGKEFFPQFLTFFCSTWLFNGGTWCVWYETVHQHKSIVVHSKGDRRHICSTTPRHQTCACTTPNDAASSLNCAWLRADLGEPMPRAQNFVLASGWGCWDTCSWKMDPTGRWKGIPDPGTLSCRERIWWALSRWCEFYPTGTSQYQEKILGRGGESPPALNHRDGGTQPSCHHWLSQHKVQYCTGSKGKLPFSSHL